MSKITHKEILDQLEGKIVTVQEKKYNPDIKDYEDVEVQYRLGLGNFNGAGWNWLTKSFDKVDKSLCAVKVENNAVIFDHHQMSHATHFAYHFGIIDETYQISERTGELSDIDFYQPTGHLHINQGTVI